MHVCLYCIEMVSSCRESPDPLLSHLSYCHLFLLSACGVVQINGKQFFFWPRIFFSLGARFGSVGVVSLAP